MPLRALLCLILLLLAGPLHAAKSERELKDLRGRIEALQKELDSAREDHKDAADELRQSEREISAVNREMRELGQQQAEVNATLGDIQRRARRLEQDLSLQQEALGQLLFQHYLAGERDPLRILLNQQDPASMARHLRYYAYISAARADTIRDYRRNLGELSELAEQEREKSQRLRSLRDEQEAQRRKLVSSQNARKTVLAKLSRQIKTQSREIGKLKRDETRLAKLVERLGKLVPAERRPGRGARDADTFQAARGKLQLPVAGELANRYGSPREDTGLTWKGIFFRAAEGAEVRAVAEGRVVFSDWLRGFGNLAIVDHGDGLMSLYGNNQTLYKRVGDRVRAGETLAAVGNSGGNPEAGLYFELRHQSRPIDPLRHMKQ